MQSELTNLFRKLIANLNKCNAYGNAYGIEKCEFCLKFLILFDFFIITQQKNNATTFVIFCMIFLDCIG